MMDVVSEKVEGDYVVREFENGTIVKTLAQVATVVPVPTTHQPTIEERFAEVNANQLILMDVLATMYEDMLSKGTV